MATAVDDLSATEGEHLPGAALDLSAGLLASPPLMKADHYGVAVVDGLLGLKAEIIKPSDPLAKELAHLLRAPVGHGLWKRPHVVPLDLLVQDVEQGGRARSHGPTERFEVLPRQSPSIPAGREAGNNRPVPGHQPLSDGAPVLSCRGR